MCHSMKYLSALALVVASIAQADYACKIYVYQQNVRRAVNMLESDKKFHTFFYEDYWMTLTETADNLVFKVRPSKGESVSVVRKIPMPDTQAYMLASLDDFVFEVKCLNIAGNIK